jgi:hypothetical protein
MTDTFDSTDDTFITHPHQHYYTDLPPSYASVTTSDPSQPRTCPANPFDDGHTAAKAGSNAYRSVPSTPLSNRRRKQIEQPCPDAIQCSDLTEEAFNTPRKKALRDAREEQGRSLLKASSSPARCSPSKRGPASSSSSPSRHSSRESVLRPRQESLRSPRGRSRSSSGTISITEGLACATVQCETDVYTNVLSSNRNSGVPGDTPLKREDDTLMNLGISTYQVVKMGLSKYTPLLKPHWLLSEPWKAEATVSKTKPASELDYAQRGHRRSKASESIAKDGFAEVLLHQKSPGTTASFINSPPLTAKEDVTILTPINTPELAVLSPPLLGPAFAEDIRSYSPNDYSTAAVRRPVAARATKGRSVGSYRSMTEVAQSPIGRGALFTKRCRRLPFASLSGLSQIQPRAASVCLSPQDAPRSSEDVGGLGIVCLQDVKPLNLSLQSPMSSLTDRKGSIDSVDSLVSSLASPTCSTSSSVPSIVVTPPAVFTSRHGQAKEQRVHLDGIRLEFTEVSSPCTSIPPTPNGSPAPPSPKQTPLGNPISLLSTPSPTTSLECTESPSEHACHLRMLDDDRGLATFKAAVDAILSDYFVYRTVTRTWRLAHQLVVLVQSVLGCSTSKPVQTKRSSSRVSSPAPWNHETPSIISSLCGQRWISQGDMTVKVPPQWGAKKLQTILKLIMDHIVTGMVALVTDDRAPYETPIALGHLCRSLKEELPTSLQPLEDTSTASKAKHSPESPVTSWVRACASAESPDSFQSSTTLSTLNAIYSNDDLEWRQLLRDTNPSAIFMKSLVDNIQTSYDKGEAIRSKANLLAVPPPRKGSRKKWQAANAEMNAQKALREKEISQVTCGIISVPEYRKRERKRAAVGSIKDNFAPFFFVRFVGELYNARVLEVTVVRQWLQRYFFKTVFPGVPSSYELEAGCAFLITVGERLDEEAGTFTAEMKQNGFFACPNEPNAQKRDDININVDIEDLSISTPGPSSAQADRVDEVPANHWILVSPRAVRERFASGSCHGNLISDDITSIEVHLDKDDLSSTAPNKVIAKRAITATMARLKEILAIQEVHAESRVWCREVLALRNRFWVQYDTGTSHKVGASIRKMKRDLW